VLRGLNASDTDSSGNSYDDAIGVYLGEVPLYYDFKMLDIARVETLLGPQGTLYGLGTLAGAIRNIPNRPNLTTFGSEAHGLPKQILEAADRRVRIPLYGRAESLNLAAAAAVALYASARASRTSRPS